MAGQKRGRKPTGNQVRSAEVYFNVTPEDAEWLRDLSEKLGFVSRAAFITAILERLRLGGMAPVTFFRVGWQIADLAQKRGVNRTAGFANPFKPLPPFELRDKPRPEPALPEGGPAPHEVEPALQELKKELQPK